MEEKLYFNDASDDQFYSLQRQCKTMEPRGYGKLKVEHYSKS